MADPTLTLRARERLARSPRDQDGSGSMRFSTMLLGSATIVLAGAAAAYADTPKDTVVMAKQIDDIISLDPGEAFEFSGGEADGNIYERLVYYDLKNVAKMYGALAETYGVAADGKTYTFKLRTGIKFSTGNVLTSA